MVSEFLIFKLNMRAKNQQRSSRKATSLFDVMSKIQYFDEEIILE